MVLDGSVAKLRAERRAVVVRIAAVLYLSLGFAFIAVESRAANDQGWLGSERSEAPSDAGWGLTSFDPRHPLGNSPPQAMELPGEVRKLYRNPDGSCVQCSIGMCGAWSDVPAAATLLWNSEYGPRERGGAWPGRVSEYARRRGIAIYNVTGATTLDWLRWAGQTGRFAACAAGPNHFQTLYGYDPRAKFWQLCDNNTPARIETYSDAQFGRLHNVGGPWVVVLDSPPSPAVPRYLPWWK